MAKDRLEQAKEEQKPDAVEVPQEEQKHEEELPVLDMEALEKSMKEPESKPEPVKKKEPEPPKELAPATPAPAKPEGPIDAGFFAEFESFIASKDLKQEGASLLDELVEKDLLSKMKQFHVHRKEGKPFFFHTDELSARMQEKLHQLKRLERDWFLRHQELAGLEEHLMHREAEIDVRVDELKHLLKEFQRKAQFDRKLKPEEYFYASNGLVLKSLRDLQQALKAMPHEVFAHHVAEGKNDFAAWVEGVFQNADLAREMRMTTSRDALIHMLQSV